MMLIAENVEDKIIWIECQDFKQTASKNYFLYHAWVVGVYLQPVGQTCKARCIPTLISSYLRHRQKKTGISKMLWRWQAARWREFKFLHLLRRHHESPLARRHKKRLGQKAAVKRRTPVPQQRQKSKCCALGAILGGDNWGVVAAGGVPPLITRRYLNEWMKSWLFRFSLSTIFTRRARARASEDALQQPLSYFRSGHFWIFLVGGRSSETRRSNRCLSPPPLFTNTRALNNHTDCRRFAPGRRWLILLLWDACARFRSFGRARTFYLHRVISIDRRPRSVTVCAIAILKWI